MIIDLLKRVCLSLEKQGIEYMISGSMALNIYSIPRMTRDIDIVVQLYKKDVDRFISEFEEEFYYYKPGILEEIDKQGMFNLIDHKTGYKIDFIIRKESEYRQVEFNRRVKNSDLGFETWIVSLEDLIISKIIWIQDYQSDKQISDIQNLLENPKVDYTYLNLWCDKLKLNTFNLIKP